MTFFNDFRKKFTKTSQNVANIAKDVAEVSNLRLQILDEERRLKGCFMHLGEQYYALHKEDAPKELQNNIVPIKESKKRISILQERIQKIEQERVCPTCGRKMPEKGGFCTHCGTKYSEKQQEKEEEVVEYKSCVSCGYQILSDAVYCNNCGVNQEEGMKHVPPKEFVDADHVVEVTDAEEGAKINEEEASSKDDAATAGETESTEKAVATEETRSTEKAEATEEMKSTE